MIYSIPMYQALCQTASWRCWSVFTGSLPCLHPTTVLWHTVYLCIRHCVILHPEDVGVFLQGACPAYTQPQFYDIQYTSVSGTVSYCILKMLECSYRELALLTPNHSFMTYSIPLYQALCHTASWGCWSVLTGSLPCLHPTTVLWYTVYLCIRHCVILHPEDVGVFLQVACPAYTQPQFYDIQYTSVSGTVSYCILRMLECSYRELALLTPNHCFMAYSIPMYQALCQTASWRCWSVFTGSLPCLHPTTVLWHTVYLCIRHCVILHPEDVGVFLQVACPAYTQPLFYDIQYTSVSGTVSYCILRMLECSYRELALLAPNHSFMTYSIPLYQALCHTASWGCWSVLTGSLPCLHPTTVLWHTVYLCIRHCVILHPEDVGVFLQGACPACTQPQFYDIQYTSVSGTVSYCILRMLECSYRELALLAPNHSFMTYSIPLYQALCHTASWGCWSVLTGSSPCLHPTTVLWHTVYLCIRHCVILHPEDVGVFLQVACPAYTQPLFYDIQYTSVSGTVSYCILRMLECSYRELALLAPNHSFMTYSIPLYQALCHTASWGCWSVLTGSLPCLHPTTVLWHTIYLCIRHCVILHPEDVGVFLQVACPAYTQPLFYDIQYTSVSGTVSYCILRMLECSYRELALLVPNHSFMTYSIPLYQALCHTASWGCWSVLTGSLPCLHPTTVLWHTVYLCIRHCVILHPEDVGVFLQVACPAYTQPQFYDIQYTSVSGTVSYCILRMLECSYRELALLAPNHSFMTYSIPMYQALCHTASWGCWSVLTGSLPCLHPTTVLWHTVYLCIRHCVKLHPEDVGVFWQVACPAYTQPQFYDIQYTSVSGTVSYCILRMLECSYRELALLTPNHSFMTYSIPMYQALCQTASWRCWSVFTGSLPCLHPTTVLWHTVYLCIRHCVILHPEDVGVFLQGACPAYTQPQFYDIQYTYVSGIVSNCILKMLECFDR